MILIESYHVYSYLRGVVTLRYHALIGKLPNWNSAIFIFDEFK